MTSNYIGNSSELYNEIDKLIENYGILWTQKKENNNPTFFEIIGKENSETVMVNALAFFLNSKNKHGFGDRVYQTLCDAIENSIIQEIIEHDEEIQYQKQEYGDFVDIMTEISHETDNDKKGRLDLIIKTSNCIIAIEAKINHALNNPFYVYDDYIEKHKEEKRVKKIVLCKRGTDKPDYSSMNIENLKELCDKRGLDNSGNEDELRNLLKKHDWVHVHWEDILIDEIDINSDYLQLWQGMKIAFEEDEIMKDEELESIKNKQIDYLKMYKIVKDISKAMENKANYVKNEVEKLIKKDYKKITNVRVWGSLSQSAEPRVVIERIGKNQKKFVVDIITSPKGYRFVAFSRSAKYQESINQILKNKGYKTDKWQDIINDKNPTNRALITKIPSTIIGNLFCDPESESKSEPDYVFRLNYNNGKDTKINKEEETIQIAKIGVKIYEQICNFGSKD